ncbi:MAG TPA: histidine kinase [Opitutaceae bacterium]|nr:histidine kinase [Opitutaceae bacterium]
MPAISLTSSRQERRLRDVAIRSVGIPLCGLAIPRLTRLFDGLDARDALYWAGTAWFVGLSFILWMGNRWLLYRLRDRHDWSRRPVVKLFSLLGATAGYSLAVAGAMLLAWYALDHRPGIDGRGLAVNLGLILAVVWAVTHLYETLFLISDRLEDRLDLERTERARLQAELAMLKNQLTPHFLFNSLNTLGVLIDENPRTARQFNQHLAAVCRYVLAQSSRDLVPLYQEMDFFHAYIGLARLRFPDSLRLELRGFHSLNALLIPPASLQLLLENALKHNSFSAEQPLQVEIELNRGRIVFTNPLRARCRPADSTGHGLRNLRERYQISVGAPIEVEESNGQFRVSLPLVRI